MTLLNKFCSFLRPLVQKVDTELPPRRIHFSHSTSKNYREVQENIFAEIKRHLHETAWTESFGLPDDPESNSLTLFIREPADILLSHGAADKNYMLQRDELKRPYLNRFKHVLVPGPWSKRRLLNSRGIKLKANQIHCVGWPRNDFLLRLREERRPPTTTDKPKVLWAPTHDYRKRGPEQESTSSYPAFEEHLAELRKLYDLSVSLHPRTRGEKSPTAELLAHADIVISDFGTMVYEAWSLGIPVVFPRWILKDRVIKYTPGSAEAYIFENNIGLHPQSIDELIRMIDSRPSVDSKVEEFMKDYLPQDTLGRSGQLIAELLPALRP